MSLADDMLAMVKEQIILGEGETVQYHPWQGTPRAIPAVVDRQEPASEFLGGGAAPALRYRVFVAKHATEGVNLPKEGFDTMALKVRPDDLQTVTCRVTRILTQDAGAYALEVVK